MVSLIRNIWIYGKYLLRPIMSIQNVQLKQIWIGLCDEMNYVNINNNIRY